MCRDAIAFYNFSIAIKCPADYLPSEQSRNFDVDISASIFQRFFDVNSTLNKNGWNIDVEVSTSKYSTFFNAFSTSIRRWVATYQRSLVLIKTIYFNAISDKCPVTLCLRLQIYQIELFIANHDESQLNQNSKKDCYIQCLQ